MTFVNGFKHDIFVSYAHVDDQPWPGTNQRWVTNLVEGLKIGLAQKLGRPDAFSLWMDYKLPGHKPLTPEIFENLEQSATLLIVLSPGYIASHWCKDEKNTFLQTVKHLPDNQSRVFVIKHSPLDEGAMPEELSDLKGYEFWADDTSNDTRRTLSSIPPKFNEELYNARLLKVVSELSQQLKALNGAPTSPTATSTQTKAAGKQRGDKRNAASSRSKTSQRVEPLPTTLRDPEASVGLFVGVGEFDKRSHLSRLPFAVDDAICLAHLFALELNLIAPRRVRLALGGEPASETARGYLKVLQEANVVCLDATKTELLYAVEDLVDLAGSANGLVALTFSTHGHEDEGQAFLMARDGSRRFVRETGVRLELVYEALNRLEHSSKLLVVDACRASMEGTARGEAAMSDSFHRALNQARGLALMTSCGVGQLSWESPELEQGVFTHFLIQGLRGDAPARPEDGLICLENVFSHTLENTSNWVRRNIKTEQLPWYGGEEVARALPLGVLTAAKRRAEALKQQTEDRQVRKENALGHLLLARTRAAVRDLISAAIQQDVERELETLSGEKLDELIENLEKLADRKASSCKMFVSWWKAEHATTIVRPKTVPVIHSPWENSLGMKFVPVGKVLFSIWPARLRDFEAFVGDTGYDARSGLFSLEAGSWKQVGHTWRHPGFPQGPMHPVAGISWEDAVAFCEWLTEKERREGYLLPHQVYRLPSDAEWSDAIGKATFPWGEHWPPPAGAGNYGIKQTSGQEIVGGTTPVGSYPANEVGIFDLGGNVWEWCSDWYKREMNSQELRDEFDFLNDDGGGSYHFIRGGSWFNSEREKLLSGYRNPGKYPNSRFANVGFRCVLDVGASERVDHQFDV